jgi:hypothetical protein
MNINQTSIFTKEELYRMNNNSKYGFNWINLLHVNHINDNSKHIKYKLYPTGNVMDIIIGREYIAFQEDKVLTYDEKRKYNIL